MANQSEIGGELKRLLDTLPAPRGIKFEKAFAGYVTALAPFAVAHVNEAISRYLAAEWPDISLKYYPRAPELAHLCRLVRSEHAKVAEKEAQQRAQAQERLEFLESEKRLIKTPEQKQRAQVLYDGFVASVYGEKERQARERMAKERAEVRARYGMSPIAMEAIPDRKLPKGMKKLADVTPGIPVPEPKPEKKPPPPPKDWGGLS